MNIDLTIKDAHRENRLFFWRISFAGLIIVVLVSVLIWRYHQLQVVRYQDFKTRADSNRLLVRPLAPPRGLIYDRNGVLLADNRPSFSLNIVKEHTRDLEALLAELGSLIPITPADIERFNRLLDQRLRPFEPVPIKYNLTDQEQGIIAVNEFRLPGVSVSAELLRHYPYSNELSHVIGYVGRINTEELQRIDAEQYAGTSIIGKTGLEKFYEESLLGVHGYETVEVNVKGQVMRRIDRHEPLPGRDIELYLDIRLQKLANQLLAGERGAVVMLDIENGGVLALASAPGFDPNLFVTGISHKDYGELVNSPDRPLYDRALAGQYPPGSTVKPFYGLAFLESNTATAETKVYDPGFFQLEKGGRKFRDWKKGGHGTVNLHDAIVRSCDVYFYTLGFKAGIDELARYGEIFGLGQKTGIDMPTEQAGTLPSRDWKRGARGEAWYPGDTVNTSIGQGFTLTTPLQLAVATARLASRGKLIIPRLVMPAAGEPPPWGLANFGESNWQTVASAMQDVIHHPRGTAHGINKGIAYQMAGKTGTAQVVGIKQGENYDEKELEKRHWDHALFIAFAPADNPRVALAVIVENGQHGSSAAAPVARAMVDAYLEYYPVPDQALSEAHLP